MIHSENEIIEKNTQNKGLFLQRYIILKIHNAFLSVLLNVT